MRGFSILRMVWYGVIISSLLGNLIQKSLTGGRNKTVGTYNLFKCGALIKYGHQSIYE